MMKPYDRIREVSERARRALDDWEKSCIDFSRTFLETLRRDLGWPESQFERVTSDRAPDHARVAYGGYTDAKGFHFAVSIHATEVIVHVSFVVRKRAEDGRFDVDAGAGHTFTVSAEHLETIKPVTAHIAKVMEEQVLAAQFAEVVGFRP